MKGHTLDCIGVFDKTSGTLISGDGLQGKGVGKYRCSLQSKKGYLDTIEKIEKDKRVENILFSHAYEPWLQDCIYGRANVEKCLQDCKKID
jgi:glyoxylase-like metal-dependent hydrolase (beta-lactamase superfamily II)